MNESKNTDWGMVVLAVVGLILGLIYLLTLEAVQLMILRFLVVVCLPIGTIWLLIKAIQGINTWNNNRFEKRLKLLKLESELEDKRAERERKEKTALTPVGEIHTNDISPQMAQLVALQIEAQRSFPPVPNNLTYSPRISYSNRIQNDNPAPINDTTEPTGIEIPTFNDLLGDGHLGNNRMLIGYNNEVKPLWDKLENMRSILICGKSGMGKSSGMRFLICQAILNGCNLIVMDPHGHVEERSLVASLAPLANHYAVAPAIEDNEILETARYANDQLQGRLKGRLPKDKPLLVVADEMTSIINRGAGEEFATLIEAIAQEGLKVGVFAITANHIISSARMGGDSSLRASFPSALVYGIERKQASLVLPSGYFDHVDTMPTGTAIWSAATGSIETVQVPNCTADDIQQFASMNPGTNTGTTLRTRRTMAEEKGVDLVPTLVPTGKERQVVKAFTDGLSMKEITRTIYGVDSGRAFNEKAKEIRTIVSKFVRI